MAMLVFQRVYSCLGYGRLSIHELKLDFSICGGV